MDRAHPRINPGSYFFLQEFNGEFADPREIIGTGDQCLDGWMDGWLDGGWMDGCMMDGWKDGRMDG